MNNGALTVTDGEEGIRSSIRDNFPDMPLFLCWNHKIANVETFLRNTLCVTDVRVISFYIKAVRDLLFQPTRSQYETLYNRFLDGYVGPGEKVEQWNKKFSDYYAANIHSIIDTLACFAVKDKIGSLWNEFSGVTTNHSEGLNNLLKWFQDRKFLSLDLVMLSIYQITIYYYNEIKRGFGNLGEYQLKTLYQSCFIIVTISELRECKHPTHIIDELDANYESYISSFTKSQTSISSSQASIPRDENLTDPALINDECVELNSEAAKLIDTNLSSVQLKESTLTSVLEEQPILRPSRYNSEVSRAISFVKDGHLTHLIDKGVYQCIDEENICHQISSSVKYKSITFSSSFSIRKKCVHIMAVEYSLNKPIDELYTMPNRAQIHKTKTSDLGHGLKMKHHATNTNQPINPIDVAINDENNVVKSSVKSKLRKKIFVKHYKYLD